VSGAVLLQRLERPDDSLAYHKRAATPANGAFEMCSRFENRSATRRVADGQYREGMYAMPSSRIAVAKLTMEMPQSPLTCLW